MRRHYCRTQTKGLVQTTTIALSAAFVGLCSSIALAQPTPPAPPTAPTPAIEPAPAPTEPATPPAPEPSAPADNPFQAPPPAPPPPPPPAPAAAVLPDGAIPPTPVPPQFPPAIPSLDYGARFRTGLMFQDPDNLKSLKKPYGLVDLDIYFAGQLTRMVKWQAGVTASIAPSAPGTPNLAAPNVQLLDVIGKFEPAPEFSIWMGRMIHMADRWTASGPWGMDEFIFPGRYPVTSSAANPTGTLFAGPKGGTNLRDWGVAVWGSLFGGHAKYFLQAMQLQDPRIPPLYNGRIQVSLLSPEPGYYHRTTYYGTRDLLAIGIGGQIQSRGSSRAGVAAVPPSMANPMGTPAVPAMFDTYKMFTADLVFEKVLGDAGTLSINGGLNLFDGDFRTFNNNFMGTIAYLLPGVVGIGKLRPSVRYQQAQLRSPGADSSKVIDVQLGYVVMGWWARLALGYRYSSVGVARNTNVEGHALFIGMTLADP